MTTSGQWDGRLRQLVVSCAPTMLRGYKSKGASLAVEGRRLQHAFDLMRKEYPRLLQHTAINEEITYNEVGDFWHVHYHVIVLAPRKMPRFQMLERWQALNSYRVDGGGLKGSRGSCYVNEKKNVKEACKYALKGGPDTLLRLPPDRQAELTNYMRNRRMLRTTGALWRRNDDSLDNDVILTEADVADELLYDAETGEPWATSVYLAKRCALPTTTTTTPPIIRYDKGAPRLVVDRRTEVVHRVVVWTSHPRVLERAREMLYEAARNPSGDLDEQKERWARAGARRRRRKSVTRLKAGVRRLLTKMAS